MKIKDIEYHLHCHSSASFLDAVSSVPEYLKECQERGIKGLALTEHGHLASQYELLNESPKFDVKPIGAIEFYVDLKDQNNGKDVYGHLTTFASNDVGYKNLLKLFNMSWDNLSKSRWGHKKPMITWDQLEDHSEGLFAGTGCLVGVVGRWFMKGDKEKALHNLDRLIGIFGKDRLFAEFMPAQATHDWDSKTRTFVKNECTVNNPDGDYVKSFQKWLWEAAVVSRGLKPVTTLDSHFVKPEEKEIQDIVLGSSENWFFHDSFHMLNKQDIFDRMSYLPGHNEYQHDMMIDNASCFCHDVSYTKQNKKIHLPFEYSSKEESYAAFGEAISDAAVRKILGK